MRSEMGGGEGRGARTGGAGAGAGGGRVREDDLCSGGARVRERAARRERRGGGGGRRGGGLRDGELDAGAEDELRAVVDGAVARVVDLEVVGALWEGGGRGPDERAAGDSSSGAVSGVGCVGWPWWRTYWRWWRRGAGSRPGRS